MPVLTIEHIESTVGVLNGQPRIAGTRVAVQHVAVRRDWPAEQIADDLEITLAQVYAALSYYYDNVDEIEQHVRAEYDLIAANATPLRSARALPENPTRDAAG